MARRSESLRLWVRQRRVGDAELKDAGATSLMWLHKLPCMEGELGEVQVWGRAPSQAQVEVLGMSQQLGTSLTFSCQLLQLLQLLH